jgi:cell division protein FtsB
MLEFESKRKVKNRIYSKFTLFVLLIIFLFVAHGAWGLYQKKRDVNNDLSMTEERLNESLKQKEIVQQKIDRLDTKVGTEEVLRENYSLAREGEKVIFLLEDNEVEVEVVEEPGFFERIGNFFSGLFN